MRCSIPMFTALGKTGRKLGTRLKEQKTKVEATTKKPFTRGQCLYSLSEQNKSAFNIPCPPKKTKQICFCQNFIKFPPILIIFGRIMAKRLKLCKVHSFSTSSNSHFNRTTFNTVTFLERQTSDFTSDTVAAEFARSQPG